MIIAEKKIELVQSLLSLQDQAVWSEIEKLVTRAIDIQNQRVTAVPALSEDVPEKIPQENFSKQFTGNIPENFTQASFLKYLEQASAEAISNGLTPEILEEILDEK